MLPFISKQQEVGLPILGGAASALLFGCLFIGSSYRTLLFGLISNLAPFPLLLLGLSQGVKIQILASLWALGIITLIINFSISFSFLITLILPSLLLTYGMLESRPNSKGDLVWAPPGRVMALMTSYTLGLLGFLFVIKGFTLTGKEEAAFESMMTGQKSKLDLQYVTLLTQFKKFLPGISALSSFLLPFFNALLAQFLLTKKHKNLRPTPPFKAIELPWWVWIALAGCGVMLCLTSGTFNHLWANACLILSVAFLFEGLGIIHYLGEHWMPGKMFLWIFYISMVLFGWPILLVIVLGIFEPWAKLRMRWTKHA